VPACRRVSEDNRDGSQKLAPRTEAASSRRALLEAAGGFALAASGLLLPKWLVEESEAAADPVGNVQQRAGKRRQRRHRRINQQRREQDRKDENPPPQFARTKWITFIAHNDTPRPLEIQVFVDEASVGTKWVTRTPFQIAPGVPKELAYKSNQVGFSVTWDPGRGTFISAIDPAIGDPRATIRHRGEEGPVLMDQVFGTPNSIRTITTRANRAPETWTVWRLYDTRTEVVFDVRFKIEYGTP
jgi:hypothetical protein